MVDQRHLLPEGLGRRDQHLGQGATAASDVQDPGVPAGERWKLVDDVAPDRVRIAFTEGIGETDPLMFGKARIDRERPEPLEVHPRKTLRLAPTVHGFGVCCHVLYPRLMAQ